MINSNYSNPSLGYRQGFKQNYQSNNIKFGNAQEIAGIIESATKVKEIGFALRRIIRLGELHSQYPTEVQSALRQIKAFHTDSTKPFNCYSRGILTQIEKTIREKNITL